MTTVGTTPLTRVPMIDRHRVPIDCDRVPMIDRHRVPIDCDRVLMIDWNRVPTTDCNRAPMIDCNRELIDRVARRQPDRREVADRRVEKARRRGR